MLFAPVLRCSLATKRMIAEHPDPVNNYFAYFETFFQVPDLAGVFSRQTCEVSG